MSTGTREHKRLSGQIIMDEDRTLTHSGRKVLMNADCLEYDVREYRDTRPWPVVEVMKYGGTTIAVERGRVEPSQAEDTVNLRKAESSLVLSNLLDRRKFATPHSDGVAPTRTVGAFRSYRPRQER